MNEKQPMSSIKQLNFYKGFAYKYKNIKTLE